MFNDKKCGAIQMYKTSSVSEISKHEQVGISASYSAMYYLVAKSYITAIFNVEIFVPFELWIFWGFWVAYCNALKHAYALIFSSADVGILFIFPLIFKDWHSGEVANKNMTWIFTLKNTTITTHTHTHSLNWSRKLH